MRSPQSLAASFAALAGVSSWVTPTSTSRPGSPMAPTTRSSTVTLARLTRCPTARTTALPSRRPGTDPGERREAYALIPAFSRRAATPARSGRAGGWVRSAGRRWAPAPTVPPRWPTAPTWPSGPGRARDQFAALGPTFEQVLGPEDPESVRVRAKLAYWTKKADGDAEPGGISFSSWEF